MRAIHFLLMAGCLGLAGTAFAADKVRTACKIDTLCAGTEPGRGAMMRCLREHKAELTADCKIAIADRVLNQPGRRQPQGDDGSARPAPSGDDAGK